jgi:hypothetical protein
MDKAQDKETVLDIDKLEKSWNESVDELRGLLGGETSDDGGEATELTKSKKKEEESDEDERDTEEEDDEGDEEDDEEESYEKSLPDFVGEADVEADIAMDVAPFLKSLAEGIQQYMDYRIGELQKSVEDAAMLTKSMSRVMLSSNEMQKAMTDEVKKIGGQPIPSRSLLSKSGTTSRFGNGEPTNPDRLSVLQKSSELVLAGKMSTKDAIILEGRVNKGQDIPDHLKPLFAQEAK